MRISNTCGEKHTRTFKHECVKHLALSSLSLLHKKNPKINFMNLSSGSFFVFVLFLYLIYNPTKKKLVSI